ncbi:MAG: Hpt domain-containing protein [Clostridia bacterium]|nr:Hpt domain-containing protein [Clostridia bacterium]
MLLKECYDSFGGNYELMKLRISKDEIIKKFVIKFLSEPSFDNLCKALEDEDYVKAFRAAHSLKGVSANLAFQRLENSVSVLTELLRNSETKIIDKEQCKKNLEYVRKDYNDVIEAIRKLNET